MYYFHGNILKYTCDDNSDYFHDDSLKGYIRLRPEKYVWSSVKEIVGNIDPKEGRNLKTILRRNFEGYREGVNTEALKELLTAYRTYVSKLSDETAKTRYNAFVYRYMSGMSVGIKAVAGKLGVTKETVFNYINRCIDDMLLMCIGIYATEEECCSQEATVDFLISNYSMFSALPEKYVFDIFKASKKPIVESNRIHTKRILEQFTEVMEEYKAYCRDPQTVIDTDVRKATVLELCIDNWSVQKIADKLKLSEETVYSDIRANRKRLEAVLFFR